ncbi:MAG: Holliday junction branch migration protein RuvA [Planctomycetes bacterium]|jgi:Holliday junction DNA helicase RuvA|nr:Holliday junction branch migration protein RuvA [Planctomycetota bacterium]MBT4028505.1 Holliday junction branch migration protein RuvA [Planctomycetota bacterium]MBT4559397.1 Holliday junction branch migration protein RuvA [Planctomycetota bacterium]MBT5102074.1 Holliday junction branch migration protein RuvA [Planctomycetota bacterium]MBT7013004.1 Holliday junction branch migration protein RuvA [Planctomycetota bacterium]
MYAFLEGLVESTGPDSVVLNVGGVGWQLRVSARTATQMLEGQKMRLLTHLSVSETNLVLFGFAEEAERALFRRLLRVNGVGPSCALALLSSLAPGDLARAILDENHKELCAIKGIGRKTADRLIIELRDHLSELASMPAAQASGTELIHVLGELGFSPADARRAAQTATETAGSSADFQTLLRTALQAQHS